jgi:hypothetical protein
MPSRWQRLKLALIVLLTSGVLSQPANAQFTQQGAKLVGAGAVGDAFQGNSVSLSADGNTAIEGGPYDNSQAGTAWIFTRSSGVWSQQGAKLVSAGAVGAAQQGTSVALSGDGNTAIVGGFNDNDGIGAVWVFTRSGNVWSQQGLKLVGTGAIGDANQGISVALSGDGNTAIVGGQYDNSQAGTAWIFTRSSGVWSQQGLKLVGAGAVGAAEQGTSVALSGDGNTAIVGGYTDNSNAGAAWVWTRSGNVWTQQGLKLVGTGAVGPALQGVSVALSADGNAAIVGGWYDNSLAGAAWVYTRSGNVWTQQSKLVGTGAVGIALQGTSVALSGDGNTAIVGGYHDNSDAGAAWVFTRSGSVWTQLGSKLVGIDAINDADQGVSVALSADGKTAILGGNADNNGIGAAWVFAQPGATSLTVTHDFNGDGKSDILFRNSSSGAVVGWQMSGGTVTSSATIATVPTNWQIVAQRDFDGDGKTDILWRDTTSGAVALWLMNGLTLKQPAISIGTVPTHWVIAGASDFNGDGNADILWYDTSTGTVAIWLMNGGTVLQKGTVGTVPLSWSIFGTTPNGGIGWRNTSGAVALWGMNGFTIAHTYSLGTAPSVWNVVGIGDFDGDGNDDLLWRNSSTGAVAIWFIVNGVVISSANVATVANSWSVDLTGDFDGNARTDILWTNTSLWTNTNGARTIWFMNGSTVAGTASLGTVPTAWVIQSNSAE